MLNAQDLAKFPSRVICGDTYYESVEVSRVPAEAGTRCDIWAECDLCDCEFDAVVVVTEHTPRYSRSRKAWVISESVTYICEGHTDPAFESPCACR
jgi:hypothetical protein